MPHLRRERSCARAPRSAPVLTLWVAAVAEREGYSWDEALSFGRAIAGRFAQAKGRSVGVFEAPEETPERAERKARERAGTEPVSVFGQKVLARRDAGGRTLAADGAGTVHPATVASYLEHAFGADLDRAKAAVRRRRCKPVLLRRIALHHALTLHDSSQLRRLAAAVPAERLRSRGFAYDLYTQIRPAVPPGAAGWGKKGLFDLLHVDLLAETLAAEEQEGTAQGGAAKEA